MILAVHVGNHPQGAHLVVEERGHGSVVAAHGIGRTLVFAVGELMAVFAVVEPGQAEEVEPGIGLDQLAVAKLGFAPPLAVVRELEDHALVLLFGPEQAAVRRVLVRGVFAFVLPDGAEAVLVVGVAVVAGGHQAIVQPVGVAAEVLARRCRKAVLVAAALPVVPALADDPVAQPGLGEASDLVVRVRPDNGLARHGFGFLDDAAFVVAFQLILIWMRHDFLLGLVPAPLPE
ncbi:hypothetical protein GM415_06130 [Pseudodesulfovibrio cashew]|uniref:Uncharacterized protein n=1 Tax=Pseudodesulfovibrio cashew TaxID=2678688 RepID=A0A6I6JH79_9BACT|nr:hypothetical protein GM415_06130 [Pseudodesulfovibrio cashew]